MNEDLLELEKELDNYESSDVKPIKCLSTRHLTEFFKHINTASDITDDNDANRERSAEVTRRRSVVACCKDLCSKRQNAAHQLALQVLIICENC